jgi:hypothetical protein
MTKNNRIGWLRGITASLSALAIFVTSSMVVLAAPGNTSLAGEITVSGKITNGEEPLVTLNGEKAFSGRTFFSSGVITTAENATADVSLGKLGSISLAPNTTLNLNFSDKTISGSLTSGHVTVINSSGVDVKISTSTGLVSNEAGNAGPMNVDASGDAATLPANGNASRAGLKGSGGWLPALIVAGILIGGGLYIWRGEDNSNNNSASAVR